MRKPKSAHRRNIERDTNETLSSAPSKMRTDASRSPSLVRKRKESGGGSFKVLKNKGLNASKPS